MDQAKSNHWTILAGLILGCICGLVCFSIAEHSPNFQMGVTFFSDAIAFPIGQVFLRLLFLVVVPLVFASLAAGVARLGDLSKLGRMGGRTLGFFLLTTTASVAIGLLAMNLIKPGSGFDPQVRQELMAAFADQSAALETTVKGQESPNMTARISRILDEVLPRNMVGAITQMKMIPLIVLAALFGIGLATQPPKRRDAMIDWLDSVSDAMVMIVGIAMKLAPVAVFCLIFVVMGKFGGHILSKLSLYVAVVLGCYCAQLFIFYPIMIRLFARRNPLEFLRGAIPIMVTAFSTSSSNATLATTMRVSERDLGIRPSVAGFVLPLGATINMNGTALFEGCVVLFIAQIFGIDISISQQLVVLLLCVVSSIGVAGVPGGSLPLLMIVMDQVGVPAAGIAIVLGVDRLLDMGRTVVNVTGDVVTAAYVEETERRAELKVG